MSDQERVCAGVDLGGTKILAVLGSRDGRILASGKIETLPAQRPASAFERIAQLLERLARECGSEWDAARVRMFPAQHVNVACSTLGDRVGALGALALAFQNHSTIHFLHT
jgi:predicted NBD/HSP70 family sugar kinase